MSDRATLKLIAVVWAILAITFAVNGGGDNFGTQLTAAGSMAAYLLSFFASGDNEA